MQAGESSIVSFLPLFLDNDLPGFPLEETAQDFTTPPPPRLPLGQLHALLVAPQWSA